MDETREEDQQEEIPEEENEEEKEEVKNEEEELFTQTETLRQDLKEELIKVIEDMVYELKLADKVTDGLIAESDDISEDDLNENNTNIVCEAFWQNAVKSVKIDDIPIDANDKINEKEGEEEEDAEEETEGEKDIKPKKELEGELKQLEEVIKEEETKEEQQLENDTEEPANDNEKQGGEEEETEEKDEKAVFVEALFNVLNELSKEELIEKIKNWQSVVSQWRKLQMIRERAEDQKRKAEELLLQQQEQEDDEEEIQPQRTPTPPPIPYTQVLSECSGTLLDYLRLDKYLLEKLEKAEVLSEDMILDIKCRANRHDRVNRLIYLLMRLGPESLRNFIEALKQSEDHYFLANILSFRTFT